MSTVDPTAVDLSGCSFVAAIRAAAAGIGREPTAEQIATFEKDLRAAAFIDVDGRVRVQSDSDAITVEQYVNRRAGHMARAATAEPEPIKAAPQWAPQDGIVAMGRGWAELQNAKVAAEVATWANPWLKGPNYNRTRQQTIQNVNPALAAEMRMKAGAAK